MKFPITPKYNCLLGDLHFVELRSGRSVVPVFREAFWRMNKFLSARIEAEGSFDVGENNGGEGQKRFQRGQSKIAIRYGKRQGENIHKTDKDP